MNMQSINAAIDNDKTEKLISDTTLQSANDAELKDLLMRAQELLAARETKRKREAIARIKALAKEHGLDVAIETNPAKRGRKPKKA